MTMRSDVEAILQATPDKAEAAIAICRYFNSEVGLMGNGWFDNDPELESLIRGGVPKVKAKPFVKPLPKPKP